MNDQTNERLRISTEYGEAIRSMVEQLERRYLKAYVSKTVRISRRTLIPRTIYSELFDGHGAKIKTSEKCIYRRLSGEQFTSIISDTTLMRRKVAINAAVGTADAGYFLLNKVILRFYQQTQSLYMSFEFYRFTEVNKQLLKDLFFRVI